MTDGVSAPLLVRSARLAKGLSLQTLSDWRVLTRPLPAFLVVAAALQLGMGPTAPVPETRDLSQALLQTLAAQGLTLDLSQIYWLDRLPGSANSYFSEPSALFSARQSGEPKDIYRAFVRLSPEGRLLEVTDVYNLTETSAVEEQELTVAGELAAWAIGDGQRFLSVQLADFRGETLPNSADWTWLKRTQRELSNLQATGSMRGIRRRSFKLDPSPSRLVLGFGNAQLLVEADAQRMRIDPGAPTKEGELRFAIEQPHHLARPGNLVTWAVDRVRAAPWFGRDNMQWVKTIGFAGLDYFDRFVGTVTGSDGSEEVAAELGELAELKPLEYTDPETGWPPQPMKPLLRQALEGEGKWVSLKDDPYVKKNPGAPSPFVFSFIRTDYKRPFSQTYVLLWDPRQVELHAASGTQEPKTATGETGDGMVPRKAGVVDRMLAGFNGGFQATHGEFGMMAEGVVYLPPKPYSATVAKLADGWTAFGTWSEDETVPDDIVSFRQNMTPLIQDGVDNPYKRSWWGGTPPGWEDESRTIRSAVCLTKDKFAAYIYGSSLDAEHLIMAAKAARCDYAIHLDMNPGHTGLEFYHVEPTGRLPETGKLDAQWQARGPVVDMPGWEFMGRRMIKYMALMNFPRYIDRESRDFFYLTLRHILPGPALPERFGAGDGWRTTGLPQHGWPFALARASVSPDPARPNAHLEVVKLDARMLKLAPGTAPTKDTVLTAQSPAHPGAQALWWTPRGFQVAQASDKTLLENQSRGDAHRVASGFGLSEAAGKQAVAAVGVDAGGMAIYVELMAGHERASDARFLGSVLSELGASDLVLFETSLNLAIGGARTLDGRAASIRARPDTHFVRGEAPGARRFLTDTKIVHPDIWAPLQRKRVRYFKKPATPAASDAAAPSADAATSNNSQASAPSAATAPE